MAGNSSTECLWYMDWLYGGVDNSIPGNGGPECAKYLHPYTRITESIFIIALSLVEVIWAFSNITFKGFPQRKEEDQQIQEEEEASSSEFHISSDRAAVEINCVVHSMKEKPPSDPWPWMKRTLLVLLSVQFGIEMGYKFSSRTLIYLLNPCHVLTMVQIFLLASDHQKNSKFLNSVFRVQLYLLNGPLLALLLPVVNTRLLPFEPASYWTQHILLYFIPFYLISLKGAYTPDDLTDVRWPVFSIGVGFLYHFIILQPIAMITQTNLNCMLCPAISDPFEGEHYRKWATLHQHALIFLNAKAYHLVAGLISQILSAVRLFCVAVTLKLWRWTIHLCYTSAAACVRVCMLQHGRSSKNPKEHIQKEEYEVVKKSKTS